MDNTNCENSTQSESSSHSEQSESSTHSDVSDLISEISDIEDIQKLFEVRIEGKDRSDSLDSSYSSDRSDKSTDTYDTFDTSDSDILKKQEIKIELLIGKKMLKSENKNNFNIQFKKLISELKNKYTKRVVVSKTDTNSDSSSEYYLHDYKFF